MSFDKKIHSNCVKEVVNPTTFIARASSLGASFAYSLTEHTDG